VHSWTKNGQYSCDDLELLHFSGLAFEFITLCLFEVKDMVEKLVIFFADLYFNTV